MADFVVDYEPNRRAEALGLEVLPATWGEGFGAALQETLTRNPTATLLREADRANYYDREYYDDFGQMHTLPAKPSNILTPQEANEKYGIDSRLTFNKDTPEPVAKELNRLKTEEILRQQTRRRSTAGVGADLTAGLLGSLADPLNIAASFVPVVGEARYASLAARFGTASARTIKGALEGATGAALIEPIVYTGAQEEQADYTAYDSLMNLTFGTIMGGGLHLGAGYIGDRWTGRAQASPIAQRFDDLPPEERGSIISAAMRQIEEGKPVDVEPLVQTALAHQDRQGFLQPHELRVEQFREKANSAGLTPEQTAALLPEDVRDSVTGFYRAEDRVPTMERALNYIRNTNEPGVYVEADIANLGGLNARFGNSGANKVYRDMANVFQDVIREAGGTGILFRHGGDEISAIVIGVPESTVDRALSKMRDPIEGIQRKYGTGDIPHAKKPGELPPGTRLNYGTAEIRPGSTPESIFEKADTRVEELKKVKDHVKRSEIGTPGLEPLGRQAGRIDSGTATATAGNRGAGGPAGYGVRAAPAPETVRAWLDNQLQGRVDPDIEAGMQAAERKAQMESGVPKETEALISDVESEIQDAMALLNDEDIAIYGADFGEPELMFGDKIAQQTMPERPILPEAYSAGPVTVATKPIPNVLYRETDGEGLADLLRNTYANKTGETIRMFVADTPELAIGQGANKGVHIQFRENAISGAEHRKPGTGIEGVTGREFRTDFVVRDPIDRIETPVDMRLKGAAKVFLNQYFDKKIENGRAIYTRKAPEPSIKPSKQLNDAENAEVEIFAKLYDQAAKCLTGKR